MKPDPCYVSVILAFSYTTGNFPFEFTVSVLPPLFLWRGNKLKNIQFYNLHLSFFINDEDYGGSHSTQSNLQHYSVSTRKHFISFSNNINMWDTMCLSPSSHSRVHTPTQSKSADIF